MTRPIQIIFSCIALAMLALFVLRVVAGDWTALNWGMLAVAATACLLVFVRFMQIFSYSYALSAIGNGLLIFALRPSVAAGLLAAVAILYGIRMSVFIWRRNQSASFAPQVAEGNARDQAMPMGVKVMLWHLCTWLFAYHLMAVYFVAERGKLTIGVLIGALVMLAGVVLEAVADAQKQGVKQRDAQALATGGLYRRIRHPNYLGEILMQLGLLVAGLSVVADWQELAMVSLAPGYLIVLMLLEARRLDAEQLGRYGSRTDYQKWRAATGALLPW
jgi:steroid 5-alpha reductase family enzyme